jgi:hypothetical protein
MWTDIIQAVKDLDFHRFNELVGELDALAVLKDPWVIVIMVVVCVVFIIRGMEKALVTFLSIPALLVLFQKTVQGSDALDFEGEKLVIFIGGFMAVAAVNVYFYFVRGK